MKYPAYKIRNNIYHYRAALRRVLLRKLYGMSIGENTRISSKAKLDLTNPKGIHIGDSSSISYNVSILTHDFVNEIHTNTYVGSYTFVGANSIILAGVRVGDHCIIGAGSVVMNDIPDRSIAAGNPARIIRANIMTGEYGIMTAGSLEESHKYGNLHIIEATPQNNMTILDIIMTEISGLTQEKLNGPIEAAGVDSFGLISLRIAIETSCGTVIPDREWSGVRKLSDIAGLASLKLLPSLDQADIAETSSPSTPDSNSSRKATKLPNPSRIGHSNRSHRIEMPQMALSGLGEPWLFKELGDVHWNMITDFLRSPSSALADENGDLEITSNLKRYGTSLFFSEHKLSGASAIGLAQTMSTFAKYGEHGRNTTLMKGSPKIVDPDGIPSVPEFPQFGQEYQQKRQAPAKAHIFECEYEILPTHDINGVGLLYFAAYPTIFDLCIERYEGKGFLISHSTVRKDLCYFANSDPTETLLFRLHDRAEVGGKIKYTASLARKSDGVRMSEMTATKVPIGQV